MLPVTDRFKQSAMDGGKIVSLITCTPPGGSPLELDFSAGSVTCSMAAGNRYTAPLTLTPVAGIDLFGLITTPGAVFAIDHGFDYGNGQTELVPMGRYELATDSASVFGGDIGVNLVDFWTRLNAIEFLTPFSPPSGLRSAAIASVVLAAIPDVVIVDLTTAGGGSLVAGGTWDTSRTQFITDMATDGGLDCFFNAAGEFVMRDDPIVNPSAVVWTFKSGEMSNIDSADRERPFDQLYNMVIVSPQDDTQGWAAQTVEIVDVNHPLHKSKIGERPYRWSSPTSTSEAEALRAGKIILQGLQGTTEIVTVGSFGNCALEAGDTVTVVNAPTDTDPGFADIHIADSFTFDLISASTDASTRTASLADIDAA